MSEAGEKMIVVVKAESNGVLLIAPGKYPMDIVTNWKSSERGHDKDILDVYLVEVVVHERGAFGRKLDEIRDHVNEGEDDV